MSYEFVKDIPALEVNNWHLILDTQDLESLAEYAQDPEEVLSYNYAFVRIGEGEYLEAYGCMFPFDNARVWRIDLA